MSKRETITRYNLIIKKLRKNPSTFAEISAYLANESIIQEYNLNTSKRTFQRDLDDIRLLYNIDIQFDFSRKVYFVDYEDEQTDANERILEAFDTFNALNLTTRLSDYIYFEKRKSKGTENLHGILHAIKNKLQIIFSYQKYWEDAPNLRTVEAYALKEFKHCWYVLAKDVNSEKIRTFALDRLTELDITKTKFQLPMDFKINEYYKYSFGIISPSDEKLEDVVLSFTPYQGKYIKSLPLHETQEVLIDTEKEFRVKLKLYPTFDFIQEIFSHGENVKVIAPDSLLKEIKEQYVRILALYK